MDRNCDGSVLFYGASLNSYLPLSFTWIRKQKADGDVQSCIKVLVGI
uniref:Uncharacterized protein n=1 Tax=Anguilla anguilla TaxID=7936 RepID=A0A0E9W3R2_ANGAN